MFKFTDLSDEDVFRPETYRVDAKAFWEKRRTSRKPYLFDLRSPAAYEAAHIPGAHSLPIEHFENSIYQMPFTGDILLYGSPDGEVLTAAEILYDNGFDTFWFIEDFEELHQPQPNWLTVTPEATERLRQELSQHSAQVVQIEVDAKSALKGNYAMAFLPQATDAELITWEGAGLRWSIRQELIGFVEGTEVFVDAEGALEIQNPTLSLRKLDGSLEEQVQILLDEQINPMVASHGGVVRLHGIKDDAVYLEFGGGCQGCGMIDVTLKQGVEVMIKENIPQVAGVFDITDHQSGENPFYR